MDCREFVHRYSDYDDSLLSAAELERFRDHLGGCDACARYDRVLRKGRMLARQLPAPEPGCDFVPRLHERLQQLRADRRRRASTPVLGGAAVALAGVTVLLSSLWAISAMADASAGPAMADRTAEASVTPQPEVRRSLPVLEPAPPREWGAWRVDQRVPVAYSPLVTGPPVYRVSDTFQVRAISSVPTLD